MHDGDALNYIYLVCNGSMEILQNQMVVAILGEDLSLLASLLNKLACQFKVQESGKG